MKYWYEIPGHSKSSVHFGAGIIIFALKNGTVFRWSKNSANNNTSSNNDNNNSNK